MTWRIRVYENSHYQDEDEAYDLKEEFPTWEAALARAQAIVDLSLEACAKQGGDGAAIYASYRMWGDDPVILGPGSDTFSAWRYAERRSQELAPYVTFDRERLHGLTQAADHARIASGPVGGGRRMDGFPDPADRAASDLPICLTGDAAAFVAAEVAAGRYPDPEAAVAQAVSVLQEEDEAVHFRAGYTRELIQAAIDSADRGEAMRIDDLRAFFDELEAEVEAEFR